MIKVSIRYLTLYFIQDTQIGEKLENGIAKRKRKQMALSPEKTDVGCLGLLVCIHNQTVKIPNVKMMVYRNGKLLRHSWPEKTVITSGHYDDCFNLVSGLPRVQAKVVVHLIHRVHFMVRIQKMMNLL